jgi:hypothetical protein
MYTKENTYWNSKGQYQSEFDRLIKLMPMSGNSNVVAGEMIRAANRLVYDYYNNGMYNNTSGALEYLYHKGVINQDTYYELLPECVREGYTESNLDETLDGLVDSVIEHIHKYPHLETKENTEDIFDFQEDSVYEGEECYNCGETIDCYSGCTCEEDEEY